MCHHPQYLVVVVIRKCAHNFVLSRRQKFEIIRAELQIVHLQLSTLVRTFANALGHSLLKKFNSETQDIFLIYRIDEFTIIEFWNVTNLIIL